MRRREQKKNSFEEEASKSSYTTEDWEERYNFDPANSADDADEGGVLDAGNNEN